MLALAAIAALILVTGVAAAAKTYATHISVRSVSKFTENSNVMFAGDLSSLNRRCLADRKMKFSKKTSSGFKLLDTDRSSANGAWAMKGNLRNNPTVKLQVAKHTRKTRVVCKGREMKISPSNY
jgi:hypothetical protein